VVVYMPVSIIIPAHNEEAVIERCLSVLMRGVEPNELDVIVVCNGCKDRTAELASAFGKPVRVLVTETASKFNALNLGDKAATSFPRFYVDADVVMPLESIREVSKVLRDGRVLAAAPKMNVDLRDRSWWVRAYYNIWNRLPYCQNGMIGSGVYALSEAGRKRFGYFPDITADDEYVRQHFRQDERLTVTSCTFSIMPPRTLSGIIAIFTRSNFGNIELRKRIAKMPGREKMGQRWELARLVGQPPLWLPLLVYVYVKSMVILYSWWRYAFGDHRKWERDDTSRQASATI
jgi:glycosyltransferase involved in cell wall biosynthesis